MHRTGLIIALAIAAIECDLDHTRPFCPGRAVTWITIVLRKST
jgi:hypothetical protein